MIGIFGLRHILILLPFLIVIWTHTPFQFVAALCQELYKYKTDQKDK